MSSVLHAWPWPMGRAVLTAEGSGELVLAVGQQLAVSVHFPCRRRILYSTSPTCLLLGWNHVIITYLCWCSIAHRASLPACLRATTPRGSMVPCLELDGHGSGRRPSHTASGAVCYAAVSASGLLDRGASCCKNDMAGAVGSSCASSCHFPVNP